MEFPLRVEMRNSQNRHENYVLFPKAEQILTSEEDEKIAEAFTEFEQTTVGAPTYERLRGMLESLASKYLSAAPVLS